MPVYFSLFRLSHPGSKLSRSPGDTVIGVIKTPSVALITSVILSIKSFFFEMWDYYEFGFFFLRHLKSIHPCFHLWACALVYLELVLLPPVCECVKVLWVLRDEQKCTLCADYLVWHFSQSSYCRIHGIALYHFLPCLPNLRWLHKISLITSALVAQASDDGAGINR